MVRASLFPPVLLLMLFLVPKYTPGEIPQLKPETVFTGRFSLWATGVHGVPMGAIASNKKDGTHHYFFDF
jgi:hypothetical protein